jgi:DNA-binding IclR family transcriptional regulator
MARSTSSLKKGLDILSFFDLHQEGLTAQTVSERFNIPLSTTYRYLTALTEKGFVRRDPDSNRYMLGHMVFKLGNLTSFQTKLVQILKPHMRRLSDLSDETVLLTIINGWDAVCIDKIDSPRLIKLSLGVGSSLPLHAGASSKILLAYKSDEFIEKMLKTVKLKQFTDFTITDPVLLKKGLEKIRKQGFAYSDQEVDLGARAISAAIFHDKAKVIAAFSIAAPRQRITNKNKSSLIGMVKDSATKASFDLGLRELK